MYHTTGFAKDEIVELCAFIHAADSGADRALWPSILGLFKSVAVALTYLRRNHVQQELAEYYAVSQSTISRAITTITPRLAQVLRQFTPTAEELPPDAQLIVDGTLRPWLIEMASPVVSPVGVEPTRDGCWIRYLVPVRGIQR